MTLKRLLILIAILLVVGITIANVVFNRTADPLYGYAVFGTQSEEGVSNSDSNGNTHAHFIVLGSDVYFDVNNDKIPEPSERFTRAGSAFEVISADEQSRYRLTKAEVGLSPDSVSESMPQHIILTVDVLKTAQADSTPFQQSGRISVYSETVDRGWAHFDGPLKFEFTGGDTKLSASGGPSVDVHLTISTPPIECSDAADGTLCSNPTTTVPGTLIPTATVQFPAESNRTITERYVLDHFC